MLPGTQVAGSGEGVKVIVGVEVDVGKGVGVEVGTGEAVFVGVEVCEGSALTVQVGEGFSGIAGVIVEGGPKENCMSLQAAVGKNTRKSPASRSNKTLVYSFTDEPTRLNFIPFWYN